MDTPRRPQTGLGKAIVNPKDDAINGNRVCPLCQGRDFLPFKLGLVQCANCRIVVSPAIFEPQANEQRNEEWFGEDYKSNRSFWLTLFEEWNNRKTLGRLDRAKPSGSRLLEIGVGSGAFLNAAREKGFEVLGCDLSDAICKRIRNAHGIEMHCGPLANLGGGSEERFDVVVMNHVLEHVQQPIDFLKEVCRLLAPGGVAHIAVPNLACWEARFRGWTSFEPYHLIYFTPETLRQTATGSGFEVDTITTHDSFSGWFLALLRTTLGVNRQEGAVSRPVESLATRGKNPRRVWVEHPYRTAMVVSGVGLWPLRWLQALLDRGDEVICIARKPQKSFERRDGLKSMKKDR